jgi:hypothetical protein
MWRCAIEIAAYSMMKMNNGILSLQLEWAHYTTNCHNRLPMTCVAVVCVVVPEAGAYSVFQFYTLAISSADLKSLSRDE